MSEVITNESLGALTDVSPFLVDGGGLQQLQAEAAEKSGTTIDELDIVDVAMLVQKQLAPYGGKSELIPLDVDGKQFRPFPPAGLLLNNALREIVTAGIIASDVEGHIIPITYNDLLEMFFLRQFCLKPEEVASATPIELLRGRLMGLATVPHSYVVAEFLSLIKDSRAFVVEAGYRLVNSQLTQRVDLAYAGIVELNRVQYHFQILPLSAEKVVNRKEKAPHDGGAAFYGLTQSHNPYAQAVQFRAGFKDYLVIDGKVRSFSVKNPKPSKDSLSGADGRQMRFPRRTGSN